jgi:hypothetical protein
MKKVCDSDSKLSQGNQTKMRNKELNGKVKGFSILK